MRREGARETENIRMEGIEAGAGGVVRGTVGEEEEGVTEMEAITTTPRMVTITTRVTITGIHVIMLIEVGLTQLCESEAVC